MLVSVVCAFPALLPVLAAIICYANSLDGDFVHDDKYAIKDNPDATGKTPLNRLFWNDFWGKPMCDNTSHKSYRPLTVLTFRLDYHLGDGDPRWFHIVNLALHVTVTWLFTNVLRNVMHVHDWVAVAAALLFAVHPVHTEAVTGIVGRAELLSCLGVLLSVVCYARSLGVYGSGSQPAASARRNSRAALFWLAMVWSAAAMLCKEHGITGIGICAALDVFVFSGPAVKKWVCTGRRDADLWALLRRLAAIAWVGVLLLWFRLWMMCGQMPAFRDEDNPASFSPSLLTRVLTFNYLVAFNVWLLLCPRVLSYDWQGGSIPLVTAISDVKNIATLSVYVIIAVAAWTCLRSFLPKTKITLQEDLNNNPIKSDYVNGITKDSLPNTTTTTTNNNNNNINNNDNTTTTINDNSNGGVSHVTKSSTAVDAGHNVLLVAMVMMVLPFLPSSNLFFRVGFVVAERVLYIPSLGFCLLVAQGAVELYGKYNSRRHPLRWCLLISAAVLIAAFAAKTYSRNYAWKSRETLFRSGLQTLPHNAKMHYNYANFLKDSGDNHRAALHYKIAIRLYPSQPSYHNNLGTVLGDSEEAEGCYRQALSLLPTHRGALVNLGNLLINRNDSTGEQLLLRALTIDPTYIDALLSLSQLELRRRRWEKAEGFIKDALKWRPDMPDLHNFYGIVFHKTGRYEEAVSSYKRAVSLNARYTPAMTNAATTLRQLGRDLEAEDLLKRAVAATQDPEAMGQLGHIYQRTGRTREAMDIYTQMAHKAPNDTALLLNFVQTLMESGQLSQAEEVLTQTLSSAPHNADVLFAMAHVHLARQQPQEALSVFREALRWTEDNSHMMGKIYYEIGNIFKDLKMYSEALQGNYSKAKQHYEEVLRKDPNNQTLLQNLAKLQRAMEKHNKHTSN